MEVLIGLHRAPFGSLDRLTCPFVEIAQVVSCALTDGIAAIDDSPVAVEIALHEVGFHHLHVGIDKQQTLVLGFLDKEIADGCPSAVLTPYYICTMFQLFYSLVCCNNMRVGAAVVGNKNLPLQPLNSLCL